MRGKLTVRDAAQQHNVSYGTAHERIRRGIRNFVDEYVREDLNWSSFDLTLIPDALWLWCDGERWTAYCVLVRRVGDTEAQLGVCGAIPGGESYAGWREAVAFLPRKIRRRVVGVTSDGHAGLARAVKELCPKAVHQRCQFHVLAELLRRLGKRAVACNPDIQRCWQAARIVLRTDDSQLRQTWYNFLTDAARMPACSDKTQSTIRWFINIAEQAMVAYDHPLADLPVTTGSAEAMCKRMRRLLLQMRPTSPEQLYQAMEVFLHLHRSVQCKSVFHAFKNVRQTT